MPDGRLGDRPLTDISNHGEEIFARETNACIGRVINGVPPLLEVLNDLVWNWPRSKRHNSTWGDLIEREAFARTIARHRTLLAPHGRERRSGRGVGARLDPGASLRKGWQASDPLVRGSVRRGHHAAGRHVMGRTLRQDTGSLQRVPGEARMNRAPKCAAASGAAIALALCAAVPAFAACPIELSVYGDLENAAGIDFRPTMNSVTVTNSFKMALDNGAMLDGIVMWSDQIPRPNGILMHECPEGDVTGEELRACTVWQGVIYTSDSQGNIGLLPAEGVDAPEKLIFPDLGPALRASSVYGVNGFSKVPWDVFAVKGCQE
jgi:hypothetical protein